MKRLFGLAVSLTLLCTAAVVAQEPAEGASDESAQKATSIIKRAADYVAGQEYFQVMVHQSFPTIAPEFLKCSK